MNFDKFVNNRVLEKFSSIDFDLQTNINNHEKQNVSLTFKVKILIYGKAGQNGPVGQMGIPQRQ